MEIKLDMEKAYDRLRGGQKKPKKLNRSRNQTETESKNRLIKLIGSVLVFILYNS